MVTVPQAPTLDSLLTDAVERGDRPFVVAMVCDGGGVLWQGCAGESAPSAPVGTDTVFRIYSQTKAIGVGVDWIGPLVQCVDGRPVDRF